MFLKNIKNIPLVKKYYKNQEKKIRISKRRTSKKKKSKQQSFLKVQREINRDWILILFLGKLKMARIRHMMDFSFPTGVHAN